MSEPGMPDQDSFTDPHQILVGEVRAVLQTMPDGLFDMAVTSPPYWGLRRYFEPGTEESKAEIGQEKSPEEYVNSIADVMDDVRRVLRADGTLWLVMGDSYTASKTGGDPSRKGAGLSGGNANQTAGASGGITKRGSGLKSKDLIGIPWMVAFELRKRGWWLRQDIIWAKSAPVPSPVRDRCTSSHEHVFLLAKSKKYYWDYQAMQEPAVYPAGTKGGKGSAERAKEPGINARPPEYKIYTGFRNKRDVWKVTPARFSGAHFATFPAKLVEPCVLAGSRKGGLVLDPFCGTGTVGEVCDRHGRVFHGIDLDPKAPEWFRERLGKARNGRKG